MQVTEGTGGDHATDFPILSSIRSAASTDSPGGETNILVHPTT